MRSIISVVFLYYWMWIHYKLRLWQILLTVWDCVKVKNLQSFFSLSQFEWCRRLSLCEKLSIRREKTTINLNWTGNQIKTIFCVRKDDIFQVKENFVNIFNYWIWNKKKCCSTDRQIRQQDSCCKPCFMWQISQNMI